MNLGSAPPSNAYLSPDAMQQPEIWLPLRLMVCHHCWLVQTLDFTGRENLFDANYAYFSSFSSSWLAHALHFVQEMQTRFHLNSGSRVLEVAANDGYLLQYVQQAGIPCYGVEPTKSTAAAARAKGLTIHEEFFGQSLAKTFAEQGLTADLTVANNVLAHVPDINDFVSGFRTILKPHGVASFEFPHLLNMVQQNQFDTAYHEHYSYLSLYVVANVFVEQGLQIFDIQEWPTHGGSLRVLAQRSDTGIQPITDAVARMLAREQAAGITTAAFYMTAQEAAEQAKFALLEFLLQCRREGRRVAAYGAAAKGCTFLNFAGIRPDLLPYVVDINPHKQGKFLPGSRIPIVSLAHLMHDQPDVILILPWNLEAEVRRDLQEVSAWGGRFAVAIPKMRML